MERKKRQKERERDPLVRSGNCSKLRVRHISTDYPDHGNPPLQVRVLVDTFEFHNENMLEKIMTMAV